MEVDLVRRRVELKYRVPDTIAAAMADALRAAGLRRESARLTTTYLDHPDRRLSRAALEDPRRASKIRLRDYGTGDGPVWLERKTREGDLVRKLRIPLERGRVPALLEGRLEVDGLRGPLVVVGAVRCRRFAVQGGDPVARVTIDRDVVYSAGAPETAAVVEVKHAGGERPGWCRALFEGRRPEGYSKFAELARRVLAEAAVA